MSEVARKLWRLVGLVIPLIYMLTNREITLIFLSIATAILVMADFIRLVDPKVQRFYFEKLPIAKEKERRNLNGTSYFIVSCLTVVLLFSKETAILSMVFLVVGDAFANLIGRKFGRHKIYIIENEDIRKTFEGSLACFVSSILAALPLKGILNVSWPVIFIGALFATIGEALPIIIRTENVSIPIEDNFTMSIVAAVAMEISLKFPLKIPL